MPPKTSSTERNLTTKDLAALRVEFVDWLLDPDRRETQQQWAAEHGVSEFTAARWKRHPEVVGLLALWRVKQQPGFALAATNMLRLALGHGPQAVAAFRALAEVMGENAPQQIDVVDRVAYVLPGSLRDLSEKLDAAGAHGPPRALAAKSKTPHPN